MSRNRLRRSLITLVGDDRVRLVLLPLLLLFSSAVTRSQTHDAVQPAAPELLQLKKEVLQKIDPKKIGLVKPQPTPAVHLSADRHKVQIGEPVKLSATLNTSLKEVRYLFMRGDGTVISSGVDQPVAVERIWTAGSFLRIVVAEYHGPPLADSVRIQVDSVFLTAEPPRLESGGRPVSFETGYQDPGASVRYRFIYGDNSAPSAWSEVPKADHVYSSPGVYSAHAEIARPRGDGFMPITNSVTKYVEVTATPVPTATITARPTSAAVDEQVRFTVNVVPDDPDMRFRYDFGDGSPPGEWDVRRNAAHRYAAAGTYTARAELGRRTAAGIASIGQSAPVDVHVTLPPPVTVVLRADKPKANVAEDIIFTASASQRSGDLEYLFDFGDGTPVRSTRNDTARHAYEGSGNYTARVSLARGGHRLPATSAMAVTVIPPAETWKYLFPLAVVLATGYLVRTKWFSLRPTFHPHPDVGRAECTKEHQCSIDVEVRVNPNISRGHYRADTPHPPIVTSIRRTHV